MRFYFLPAAQNSMIAFLFVVVIGCHRSDSWNETLSRQLHRDTSMIKIDTEFYNFMMKYNVPAISIAVAKNDSLVYLKSFGLANLSDGVEVDNKSLFRIIQSSMTVTSLAIKKLIAEGLLNYNSKVFGNGGILGFQYGRNQYETWITDLTVENLLKNQVGGWYGVNDMTADTDFRQLFSSKDSALSWVLDHVPLQSGARDTSNFSEFNYFVLGRVIEKVSGMPYENYVKENILRPAGILDMELAWDSASRPNEVSYYFPSPTPTSIRDLVQPRSNGKLHENLFLSRGDAALGWIASAADMVKLMIRYKTFSSLNADLSVSRVASLTDTARARDGDNFDWCSAGSTADWYESFQFLGSSTAMMRCSGGFCCTVFINTFRPDSSQFFPDIFRMIKKMDSDSPFLMVNLKKRAL